MSTFFSKNLKRLREDKGVTQQEVADNLGISRSAYVGYEQGQNDPRASLLKDFADYFNVGFSDLLGKTKNDLVTEKQQSVKILTIPVSESSKELIAYVPLEARAGYLEGYDQSNYIQGLNTFGLPKHEHGTYRAFEIKGDSMPPINDGFIVICRYLESLKEIKSNYRYVLITKDDGLVFKRVHLHKDKLILSSDNLNYPPYTVDLDDIREIWQFYSFIGFPDYNGNQTEQILQKLDYIENKISEGLNK